MTKVTNQGLSSLSSCAYAYAHTGGKSTVWSNVCWDLNIISPAFFAHRPGRRKAFQRRGQLLFLFPSLSLGLFLPPFSSSFVASQSSKKGGMEWWGLFFLNSCKRKKGVPVLEVTGGPN